MLKTNEKGTSKKEKERKATPAFRCSNLLSSAIHGLLTLLVCPQSINHHICGIITQVLNSCYPLSKGGIFIDSPQRMWLRFNLYFYNFFVRVVNLSPNLTRHSCLFHSYALSFKTTSFITRPVYLQ